MTDLLNISVEDGKYTVIQHQDGSGEILRNNRPWLAPLCDVRGSKMILAFAYELEAARERIAALEAQLQQHRSVISQLSSDSLEHAVLAARKEAYDSTL